MRTVKHFAIDCGGQMKSFRVVRETEQDYNQAKKMSAKSTNQMQTRKKRQREAIFVAQK